jgi:hypothetical protein
MFLEDENVPLVLGGLTLNLFLNFLSFFNYVNISSTQVLAKTARQVLKMLMLLGLTLYILHPQKKSYYLPFTHLHL